MRRIPILILFILATLPLSPLFCQSASPTISFTTTDEDGTSTDVQMSPSESQTAPAPLTISCEANVDAMSEDGTVYNYVCEWRIYNSDEGETSPLLTRFDDDLTYTLTSSGGYGVKLYITFVANQTDTIEYECDPFSIVISESKLTCPDGFSPNGDGINDVFHIEFESIVKASGVIFNRWGKKLHTFTLSNLKDGWDGMVSGKPVKDGVYFINLDATGSDGLHYKIKKAINVLKGFRETDESSATEG